MLASALLALIPFILVTTAGALFRKQVEAGLGAAPVSLELVAGLSTAGYCFGALLGGDLINRIKQRHLFLSFQALFLAGCLFAAVAGGLYLYAAGRILFGFATGVMLVSALPPVIRRFPARQMPFTAIFINIAFFGAVTGGPLIGGIVAALGAWRSFYGLLAAIGAVNFALALAALPPTDPFNPDLKFDHTAIVLGAMSTALPFWGSGELTAHGFASPLFWAPMSAGLIAFVALLLVEYHKRDALSPVTRMWSTFPVTGMLAAMAGGAVLVTLLQLALESQLRVGRHAPLIAGLSFWPQIIGTVIAAVIVGLVLRTRYLPLTILAGMILLLGAAGLLLLHAKGHTTPLLLAASGLLGLGAGLTVAPGLFMSGLPLPSMILGRIFALLELVRSVADFVLAPVLVKIARLNSDGAVLTPAGVDTAVIITMIIAAAMTLLGLGIYLSGRPGLPQPDLEDWLDGEGVAIHSPAIGAGLRRNPPPPS